MCAEESLELFKTQREEGGKILSLLLEACETQALSSSCL